MSLTHTPGRHLADRPHADAAEAAGVWLLLVVVLLLTLVAAVAL